MRYLLRQRRLLRGRRVPHGATTTYTYSANTEAASEPNGTATTTLDGLGRPVRVQARGGVVDYEYGPCACSPIGKLTRVTEQSPKPEEADHVTTYAYNLLGQLTTVTMPRS